MSTVILQLIVLATCACFAEMARSEPHPPPTLLIACLGPGGTPPPGYVVIDKRLLEARSIPACQSEGAVPIIEKGKSALLSGSVALVGHKLLQFSHDSKMEDIHRVLAMYSVPKQTAEGLAPRISKILKSGDVKKGLVGVVAVGVVGVGVELFKPSTSLATTKPPSPAASGVVKIEPLPTQAASRPKSAP